MTYVQSYVNYTRYLAKKVIQHNMGMHKILELELIAYYDESITVAVRGGGGRCLCIFNGQYTILNLLALTSR